LHQPATANDRFVAGLNAREQCFVYPLVLLFRNANIPL
jgi:hypothetical protein